MQYVDETVLDNGLTSIANSIRGRTGGNSQLAFPAGFVAEINGFTPKSEHLVPLLDSVTCSKEVVIIGSPPTQENLIQVYNLKKIINVETDVSVSTYKTRGGISKVYKIDATTREIVELTDDDYVPADDDYTYLWSNSGTVATAIYLAQPSIYEYYEATKKLLGI